MRKKVVMLGEMGVGKTSIVRRVVLDQFVYVGQVGTQKMAVNLAKGVFRFTTGALDKNAYNIATPTAAIGVGSTGIGATGAGASMTGAAAGVRKRRR